MEDEYICIYHSGCIDGFGAAWVVKKFFTELGINVEFHKGVYNETPPDVTGKKVIMVDFSYKHNIILDMAIEADSILIIDHHKTAAEDLVNLPNNVEVKFDMDHSGAVLTWLHFYPEKGLSDIPLLLMYIEDRDLWKFRMNDTKSITSALYSYDFDFDTWDELMECDIVELESEGLAIHRNTMKSIKLLINHAATRMQIGGYDVPVLNAPYMFASEAGHIMCQNEKFSATWYETENEKIFSLRSSEDGLDVSKIAESYGGGGHEHSAGFKLEKGEEL
ncbi:phosphohydrolase [Candidatus Pacearchaeota archaeon]|nr:phosphohydrolase [Candidatus Pacearchaeota archaeon]